MITLALPHQRVSHLGVAAPDRLDIPALLGAEAWALLPPTLRARFAAGRHDAAYQGTMTLSHSAVGAGFALLLSGWHSPLPRATGHAIATTVRVETCPDGVVWDRAFATGGTVRSVKSAGPGGTVLERTQSGLGMVLALSVEDGALVFTSRRFFLALGRWRLPIPGWLTPGRCRVEHRAVDAQHFRFTMTMTHPLWGTTFHQTGVFADVAAVR